MFLFFFNTCFFFFLSKQRKSVFMNFLCAPCFEMECCCGVLLCKKKGKVILFSSVGASALCC